MTESVIDVSGVSFSYHKKSVLEDINLLLEQGEFLGLVGPNGSGKSTLIKIILGLERPQRGEIRLFGERISQFRAWSRLGYVSQKANSFNTSFPATVFEVISSGLYGKIGLLKWLSHEDKQAIHSIIERVGLSALKREKVGDLSGGEQQRVFIARALVAKPDLLILDEPTVGVDAESVKQFFTLLDSFRLENDLTILLVSHDIGAITTRVSRVACLNRSLHYHGDPQEFAANQEEILARTYGRDLHFLEHGH